MSELAGPCWECLHGRHVFCTGWDDQRNLPCSCEVIHDALPSRPEPEAGR